jgi:hypothetical protein
MEREVGIENNLKVYFIFITDKYRMVWEMRRKKRKNFHKF